MSTFQKIWSIVLLAIIITASVFMIMYPVLGHYIIIAILSVTMIVAGIKDLIYYFSMTRFMVGGKTILYKGIIFLNFGFFTFCLYDIQQWFITLYMVAICLFAGFIAIMRANEQRKHESSWKLKFIEGLIYVAIAIVGLVFINSEEVAVYIYCTGLLYFAITKIISAFKTTAVVYIQ